MKMHYMGEIIHENGNVLPGWAACCSGDQAVNIRAPCMGTYVETDVTCEKCKRMIRLHKDYKLMRDGKERPWVR